MSEVDIDTDIDIDTGMSVCRSAASVLWKMLLFRYGVCDLFFCGSHSKRVMTAHLSTCQSKQRSIARDARGGPYS